MTRTSCSQEAFASRVNGAVHGALTPRRRRSPEPWATNAGCKDSAQDGVGSNLDNQPRPYVYRGNRTIRTLFDTFKAYRPTE